jgi:hypothetical protein
LWNSGANWQQLLKLRQSVHRGKELNVTGKGKVLKTWCKGQQLTSTMVPHAGHTAKSEKGTTVSAEQLSLRRPTIKSEKGGKKNHCVNF